MAYRIISVILGILLLVAAVAKLQGFAIDPVAQVGIFSASWFQMAVIEFEVLLGVWLLWGANPIGSWIATLSTFTAFAGFSFYSGWIGQASCGCFGKLPLSPWWAFAMDALIVAGALLGRPSTCKGKSFGTALLRETVKPAIGLAFATTIMVCVITLAANSTYGSMDAALAHLRGERVSLKPSFVDVGTGAVNEFKETTIELTNWTDHSIRVIGGSSDCSCITTHDLLIDLPPSGSCAIMIAVRLPNTDGTFSRDGFILLDEGGIVKIPFRLTGRARDKKIP